MLEEIVGNDHIKLYLKRLMEKKAVANSLLFAGPDGIGKSLFAKAFSSLLIGKADNHPDIHEYKPEGKIGMHSIASLRTLSEEVYMAPFESKWKIFIVHDAERMLPSSANALLKTFEEPAPDSVIILLSSNPALLLPTVLSRCRTIHFHTIAEEEIVNFLIAKRGVPLEMAKQAAVHSYGSIGEALRWLEQGGDKVGAKVLDLLKRISQVTYKQMCDMVSEICALVEESKNALQQELEEESKKNREYASATQKDSLEKELEGAITMRQTLIAKSIFEDVLWWFRDLHLLHLGGREALLRNKDKHKELDQALQRGEILPLEIVEKSIKESKLALERSTSLNICLENLFLKLGG